MIRTQIELPPPNKSSDHDRAAARHRSRNDRYRLRRVAGRLIAGRVEKCGHTRHSSTVDIFRTRDKSKAAFHGITTCGSIWHCPVCAGKISAQRSGEVQELAEKHQEAVYKTGNIAKLNNGWREPCMFMATLTVRHHKMQQIADLKQTVTLAWQRFQAGAVWGRVKSKFGIIGVVRSIEVTHGQNGWHPHLHLLIFTEKTLSEQSQRELQERIFARWINKIECLGGTCDRGGLDFREARGGSGAAEYVSKWGAGAEVAKGQEKTGKRGSRSPWQLLRAYEEGDRQAGALFAGYAKAFKGARHLTYTKNLRERYGLRDVSDEELASKSDLDDSQPELLMSIEAGAWDDICKTTDNAGNCLQAQILAAAESGGREAILSLLSMYDIDPSTPAYHSKYYDRPDDKKLMIGNLKQKNRDAWRGFREMHKDKSWKSVFAAPDFEARSSAIR